ncbi:MAG: 2-C-methyl-D-erythritol 2,4-cyclodiphosphate synthase [Candidatus Marinimicrobia bacterium]|nr:2-C-methyl-D-erythritol 2,4-cyclodiphosphate synthase [Candidatus Neomarinimicrobiota bacterium]MCF7903521.1 2-C-methyl-D-erythritol 2,4-cyclodiphosphate synthase [Candidatus Neomarinimicrobiota bacterium]
MKIGTGYDVHQLVEDRKLVLGGVEVPFEKGTLGHSDGDALTHAICDALLGALAMGDIGQHFPDTDPDYEGAYSINLLKHVSDLVAGEGYAVGNVDATVVLQQPKLKSYITGMRKKLSETMGISMEQVSVKATTTEGLGMTGSGAAVEAQAVCLLVKN